ncbi:MAG: alpha/beta fold hydrolase [Candidatus Melainabacteria bacterium]|nr:alpha/beta fold hydrolase [Candidatus Melainabacteria bacterium]
MSLRLTATLLYLALGFIPVAAAQTDSAPTADQAPAAQSASVDESDSVRKKAIRASTDRDGDSDSKRDKSERPTVVRAKGKSADDERASRGVAPCLAWVNRDKPIQAVIVCVHGLGLHNGTYEAFGKRMAELGYATYAIDVRGFGAWMEAKGRERVDFEHCLNDVRTTLKVVRRVHPGKPVFLLGESMGGAIALRVTSLYPELVDGLISVVPAGDRFKQGKTHLKVALNLFSSPNKPMKLGEGVVRQATQNEALRKSWLEDPLARVNLSAKELLQFQNFMNGNHEAAKSIMKTAVLIVQGCQDKLVRPEGTVELFNDLGTADRQIVLIPKAEHLIFEEAQFTEEDITTVNTWIAAHLQKVPSIEAAAEVKKSDREEKSIGKLE